MSKKYLKDLVPLVAICLVAALFLGICNLVTEGPIAANAAKLAQETRVRLLPAAATFEAVELEEGSAMDSCYEGLDANGESVGYVVETTVGGYGGEIVVTVGVDPENTITGINVGGENFSETAGLGALAKEASFTDQFIGESAPLTLSKGESGTCDGIIDAISGATITSTAVNGGVNSAAKFIMDMNGGGSSPNTASVQGFAGPVAVTLSLDEAGAITEITIGDAFFNETPGYGAGALEEAFQAQFIGKVPPLALADIDQIAGATITSNAVINAVNQVQAQLSGAAPVAAPAEEPEPVAAASENALTASADGFAGPVAVAVDLDESGAITAITIGDASFAETAGFGAKALEDAFKAQFIGKTLPVAFEDIDAIAGATITSKAVVKALNAAGGFEEEEVVPAAAPVEAAEPIDVADGTYSASVQGFAGPVAVEVTVAGNAISAIKIGDDAFAETAGFGAKALEEDFQKQFIGKSFPIALTDVDAIAGATVTSQAVVDAISAAIAAPAAVEEVAAIEVADGTYAASAQGFAGPVAVEVTVAGNAISAIKIGDDAFAETAGFGAKALEEDFQKQFIGKTFPIALTDIDAIAGATVTSQAVVDAISAAIAAPAVVEEEVVEEVAAIEVADGTYSASAQGFAGPVAVEVTVAGNAISAIKIGDDAFAETAGFGAKALEEDFQKQFIGKTFPIALADIDAIAGATVTSQAVVDAISAAIAAPAAVEEVAAIEVADGTYAASAQGFAGPVAVEVTVAGNAISAIKIGDDAFAETAGFGAKALEEDFQKQFIGKFFPIALTDIDAIAGATITSQAVVDAISAAIAAPAVVEEVAAVEVADGTYAASDQGFAGPVAVEVTVAGNAITAIKIGDDAFAETAGFGAKALEEDFQKQFIGKSFPIALTDIDAIAGATVTSQAVVDAISAAIAAPAVVEEEIVEEVAAIEVADGTYAASAQGFAGPVAVEVTVAGNAISAIKIGDDAFAETAGFGAKALEEDFQKQFIGKTFPIALTDIDAIAGATVTSQAVVDAISAAIAAPAVVEEEIVEEVAAIEVADGTYAASAQGFAGPVAVEVTVADNAISSIKIGDDAFAETAGFGAKALEEDFQKQFIGKTFPITLADIDAIAGATVTSQAVVDAISAAIAAPAVEAEPAAAEPTVLKGTAQGFGGPVAVEVTVDEKNVITAITIGDENFAETVGFGSNVQRESYTSQFIGKTLPLAEGDIDAVTGATITSNAVLEAIKVAK